jgi:hypothetical protein
MNFQNPTYNHKRGIIGDSAYKEYIPSSDLSLAIDLANTFHDGIQAVRGTTYTVKSAANLYPTAGTSDDYAYSRHFVDSTKEKVIAYTLEWGTEFQPPYAEMQNIIQEITSGLLAFCLWVCNSPRLQLSRLTDRVESLQSQVKQLQEITSLGKRRKATSIRARSSGSNRMKTKKKTTKRRLERTKKK